MICSLFLFVICLLYFTEKSYNIQVDSFSRDDGVRESITVVNLDTLCYW